MSAFFFAVSASRARIRASSCMSLLSRIPSLTLSAAEKIPLPIVFG
jgi:hypothetical protein